MEMMEREPPPQLAEKLVVCLSRVFSDLDVVSVNSIKKLSRQGRSSCVYSLVATFRSEGRKWEKAFILKLYRWDQLLKGRKEFKIQNFLKERNLPVPTPYYFYEKTDFLGNPFMVMEQIDGTIAMELLDSDDAERVVELMAKCLYEIHQTGAKTLEGAEDLLKQFAAQQQSLLGARFFVSKLCPSHFGFAPSLQKRLLHAIKKMDYLYP